MYKEKEKDMKIANRTRLLTKLLQNARELSIAESTGVRQQKPGVLTKHNFQFQILNSEKESANILKSAFLKDFLLFEDFVTEEEEKCLLEDTKKPLARLKYEYDHWDGVGRFKILHFVAKNLLFVGTVVDVDWFLYFVPVTSVVLFIIIIIRRPTPSSRIPACGGGGVLWCFTSCSLVSIFSGLAHLPSPRLESLSCSHNILPAHSFFPSVYFCILAVQSSYLIAFYIINNTNFLKVRDFRRAVTQSGT